MDKVNCERDEGKVGFSCGEGGGRQVGEREPQALASSDDGGGAGTGKPFDFLFIVEEEGGGIGFRLGSLFLTTHEQNSLSRHTQQVVGSSNFYLETGQMALVPGPRRLLTVSRAGATRPSTTVEPMEMDVDEDLTIDARVPVPPRPRTECEDKVSSFSPKDRAILESGMEQGLSHMGIKTVEDVERMLKQDGGHMSSLENVGKEKEVVKSSGISNIKVQLNGEELPPILEGPQRDQPLPGGSKVIGNSPGSPDKRNGISLKRLPHQCPVASEARRCLKIILPPKGTPTTTPPVPPAETNGRILFYPQNFLPEVTGKPPNPESPMEPFEIGSFNLQTKRYNCDLCPKECGTVNNMRKHYGFHHFQIRYGCEVCPRTFLRKNYFMRHFEAEHAGIRFMCGTCNRTFTKKYDLRLHLTTSQCGSVLQTKKGSSSKAETGSSTSSYFKVLNTGKDNGPCRYCCVLCGMPVDRKCDCTANANVSASLGKDSWSMTTASAGGEDGWMLGEGQPPPKKKRKVSSKLLPSPDSANIGGDSK